MAFQILRPFTLAFTVSQRDGHGMRVNCNIGDLCLSVSPRCIEIIKNTVQVWTLFKITSLFKISYFDSKPSSFQLAAINEIIFYLVHFIITYFVKTDFIWPNFTLPFLLPLFWLCHLPFSSDKTARWRNDPKLFSDNLGLDRIDGKRRGQRLLGLGVDRRFLRPLADEAVQGEPVLVPMLKNCFSSLTKRQTMLYYV